MHLAAKSTDSIRNLLYVVKWEKYMYSNLQNLPNKYWKLHYIIHYGGIRVSAMVGTSGKPNAWYVNQELSMLANSGAVHVRSHVEYEKHKMALGAETSSSKVTSYIKDRRCVCIS